MAGLFWWQNHRMMPTGISSASIVRKLCELLSLDCLPLSDVSYAFFFLFRQAPRRRFSEFYVGLTDVQQLNLGILPRQFYPKTMTS
jgi:hypothetical protein